MCGCSESAGCKDSEAAKNGVYIFVNVYFDGKRNTVNSTLWADINFPDKRGQSNRPKK